MDILSLLFQSFLLGTPWPLGPLCSFYREMSEPRELRDTQTWAWWRFREL